MKNKINKAGFLIKDQVTIIDCVNCGKKTSSVKEIQWKDGDTLDTRDIITVTTTNCFNCSTKK